MFFNVPGEPAKKQQRAAHQRHLCQRQAERKLDKIFGAIGSSVAQKSALDFAAPPSRFLRNDEQARVRITCELLFAPKSAGGDFCGRVAGGVEGDARGCRAGLRLLRFAPGGEELALRGQNAIEAGQQQRRAMGVVGFKLRGQFQRQTRHRNGVFFVAELVELRQPGVEGGRVLRPVASRVRIEQLRRIGAEQAVRIHGQRGQTLARTGQLRGQRPFGGDGFGPKRLLLLRI